MKSKIIKIMLSSVLVLLMLSGCAEKKPLLPPMSPIVLSASSISNLSSDDVQVFVSRMMNQKVKAMGGGRYLNDPKHLAISVTGVNQGSHDDRYVLWEKYSYSYAYGYYYVAEKNEIIEVPVSTCISSYLSGTSGEVHTWARDCEEFTSLFNPGQDFKDKVLLFRAYMTTDFANDLARYNTQKSK